MQHTWGFSFCGISEVQVPESAHDEGSGAGMSYDGCETPQMNQAANTGANNLRTDLYNRGRPRTAQVPMVWDHSYNSELCFEDTVTIPLMQIKSDQSFGWENRSKNVTRHSEHTGRT
jgi:hypothetical protein